MPPRPGRVRALAALGMAAFLGAILVAKPTTLLPRYTLAVSAFGTDQIELSARPETPVEVALQAHAFALVGGRVSPLDSSPIIEPDGAVRARCERPPGADPRSMQVGLLIGHADSTPSPEEAWEELESEGPPRPTFRLLLAPVPAL